VHDRQLLREIIEHKKFTFQWTEADLARAEYRLSVVLGMQNRRREAAQFAGQALERRNKWENLLEANTNAGKEQDAAAVRDNEVEMTLFDLSVCLWHGRTTGPWKNGDLW
jgi:hypothetical protein